MFEFLFRIRLENERFLCARCGERFAAVGCMGEHDRDRHGCSGIGWGGCGGMSPNLEHIQKHIAEEHEQKDTEKSLLE